MDERELTTIQAQHQPRERWCSWRGAGHEHPVGKTAAHGLVCAWCTSDDQEVPYPCDAARLLAEVRHLQEVHYLPMDCPACGRHRLEYDRLAHRIRCEKCHAENWEAPDPRGQRG